jgi:NAD(P)-dependent dehydrogenase (short-subunit alcohol dehydrogenase family)
VKLQDKVAIVTGSTKGIGRAIAIGYANEGATVVVCGRSLGLANGLADELTQQGKRAVAMRLDVADPGGIDEVVGNVVGRLGGIDILVNNASSPPDCEAAKRYMMT